MVVVSTKREPGETGFSEASIDHELTPTLPEATVVEVVLEVVELVVVEDEVVVAAAGATVVLDIVVAGIVVVDVVDVVVVVVVVEVVVVAFAVHCANSARPPAGIVIEAFSA
jgi:hypothetical protein